MQKENKYSEKMILNPLFHFRKIRQDIQVAGFRGPLNWAERVYYKKRGIDGTCIFDLDWDILVVLDACRADLFHAIVNQYDFLASSKIGSANSVGSTTASWMDNTFTEEHESKINNTIYVSGNPYTNSLVNGNQFEHLDEVWRYAWDKALGTVPPRPITDRGITHYRAQSPDRLLLHYMQPHIPFIATDQQSNLTPGQFGENRFDDTWLRLRDGDLSRSEVWKQYEANLQFVLEDVKLLLSTLNAETVILTSDHGNAFGEAGLFGHYRDVPIPALRNVPFVETKAEHTYEYKPSEYDPSTSVDTVSERLSALGYID